VSVCAEQSSRTGDCVTAVNAVVEGLRFGARLVRNGPFSCHATGAVLAVDDIVELAFEWLSDFEYVGELLVRQKRVWVSFAGGFVAKEASAGVRRRIEASALQLEALF
jgi:hypothetical protein